MKGWRVNQNGTKTFANTKIWRVRKELRGRLQIAFTRSADPAHQAKFKTRHGVQQKDTTTPQPSSPEQPEAPEGLAASAGGVATASEA
jgi:hypothetical protein